MKLDINICNNLKSIRNRLGMSQQDLANIAGVTRQSIGGVESGQYAPSVTISLRLAKALGCQVEDLFWLEENLPKVEAILAKPVSKERQSRVSLARVGDQWIAYPLVGNDAFRLELIPADGEVVGFPSISKRPNAEGEVIVVVSQSDVKSCHVSPEDRLSLNAMRTLTEAHAASGSGEENFQHQRPKSRKRHILQVGQIGHCPPQFSGSPHQVLAPPDELYKVHDATVINSENAPTQSAPVEKRAKGLRGMSKLPFPEGEAHNHIGTNKVLVRLLDDMDKLHNTVVIAGCTPVLSLLARATERCHPQLRVHYHFAHSMAALRSLCRGEVHIAGMHLYDPQTGEHNIPFVREALAGKNAILITLGVWEEGLLVAPGNPMGIQTVTDLVALGATIVTHEASSGSRMLLERKLQEERVPFQALKGFDHIVHNHQEVAFSIVSGIADAGISTASIAAAFGLGFIPLHQSRYDLVILNEYLEEAPVQQFLSILGHRLVRAQLEMLGGYDISKIGQVVANI